jgi:hypothetical protein
MILRKVLDFMSFCTKCGSEMPEGALFCSTCGASVEKEAASTPPTYTKPKFVSSSLFDRMIRAARLDVSLYEEVEADEKATTQAFTVVMLSSICAGIGTGIREAVMGHGPGRIGIGFVGGLVSAFVVWFIWSFVTYFIGTKVFGGTASFGELLRTIGFSNSPGVLLILSFIPILGGLVSFVVSIWQLMSMVVAVRQALDFTTGKAVLTCIVGWIVATVLLVIIGMLIAIPFIFLSI